MVLFENKRESGLWVGGDPYKLSAKAIVRSRADIEAAERQRELDAVYDNYNHEERFACHCGASHSTDDDSGDSCDEDNEHRDKVKSTHISLGATTDHQIYAQHGKQIGRIEWESMMMGAGNNRVSVLQPLAKYPASELLEKDAIHLLSYAMEGLDVHDTSTSQQQVTDLLSLVGCTTEKQIVAFLRFYGFWLGDGFFTTTGDVSVRRHEVHDLVFVCKALEDIGNIGYHIEDNENDCLVDINPSNIEASFEKFGEMHWLQLHITDRRFVSLFIEEYGHTYRNMCACTADECDECALESRGKPVTQARKATSTRANIAHELAKTPSSIVQCYTREFARHVDQRSMERNGTTPVQAPSNDETGRIPASWTRMTTPNVRIAFTNDELAEEVYDKHRQLQQGSLCRTVKHTLLSSKDLSFLRESAAETPVMDAMHKRPPWRCQADIRARCAGGPAIMVGDAGAYGLFFETMDDETRSISLIDMLERIEQRSTKKEGIWPEIIRGMTRRLTARGIVAPYPDEVRDCILLTYRYCCVEANIRIFNVSEQNLEKAGFTIPMTSRRAVFQATPMSPCLTSKIHPPISSQKAPVSTSPDAPFKHHGPTSNEFRTSAKWFFSWCLRLKKLWSRALLNGLSKADSLGSKGKSYSGNIISTRSESFRDEVSQICMHAGYSSYFSLATLPSEAGGTIDEGMIIGGHQWAVYYYDRPMTSKGSPLSTLLKKKGEVSTYRHVGRVWCVNVPNSFVIVRRARKDEYGRITDGSQATIQGNCFVDDFNMPMRTSAE